jgi:hypothetical protein
LVRYTPARNACTARHLLKVGARARLHLAIKVAKYYGYCAAVIFDGNPRFRRSTVWSTRLATDYDTHLGLFGIVPGKTTSVVTSNRREAGGKYVNVGCGL